MVGMVGQEVQHVRGEESVAPRACRMGAGRLRAERRVMQAERRPDVSVTCQGSGRGREEHAGCREQQLLTTGCSSRIRHGVHGWTVTTQRLLLLPPLCSSILKPDLVGDKDVSVCTQRESVGSGRKDGSD